MIFKFMVVGQLTGCQETMSELASRTKSEAVVDQERAALVDTDAILNRGAGVPVLAPVQE
jgi:hypothetical protein